MKCKTQNKRANCVRLRKVLAGAAWALVHEHDQHVRSHRFLQFECGSSSSTSRPCRLVAAAWAAENEEDPHSKAKASSAGVTCSITGSCSAR